MIFAILAEYGIEIFGAEAVFGGAEIALHFYHALFGDYRFGFASSEASYHADYLGSALTAVFHGFGREKLGIKISFDGKEGYCLEAQSQDPRHFTGISDICKELYEAAGINQES